MPERRPASQRGRMLFVSACIIAGLLVLATSSWGRQLSLPSITMTMPGNETEPARVSTVIQLLFLLTILSLAPAVLIMLTSFTRIVVVLSLLRQAMGTQQVPGNQIIIGLSLFLTFFIMMPVWNQVNGGALQPYMNEEISQEKALDITTGAIRTFMLKQTREKDIALFTDISKHEKPRTPQEVRLSVLIPAFVISELKTAFQIGFMIYIPFLILDMVVASVLLSMGMMMLPPIMVSLPFKLLLFVLVDGWYLVVGSIVQSFG